MFVKLDQRSQNCSYLFRGRSLFEPLRAVAIWSSRDMYTFPSFQLSNLRSVNVTYPNATEVRIEIDR